MGTSPTTRRHRARAFFTRLTRPMRSPTRSECPICLDVIATDSANASVALHCGHAFCRECLEVYANGKVRDRLVRTDQLVCPVVECKRSLNDRDLRHVLNRETFVQCKAIQHRVRDEKHPLARWCPRPECGELIRCTSNASVFSCPACGTLGCFHCRGPAHRFAFLCGAIPVKSDDASYVRWEKSVGDGRAVRACPRCHMRIWKIEGCNHMTCTHCYHQYCWVCDAPWHRRHYACGEADDALNSTDAFRRRAAQLELLVIRVMVALLACVSAIVLAPCFVLVAVARQVPVLLRLIVKVVVKLVEVIVLVVKALLFTLAALLGLPFFLVLAIRDAFQVEKPRPLPTSHIKRRIT